MKRHVPVLAGLLAVALPSAVGSDDGPLPDEVVLSSGATVKGRVVYEDLERLVVRVKSRERVIERSSVDTVRAAIRELPLALDLMAEVDEGDVGRLLELARQLDEMNLPYEARLVRWCVLTEAPASEEAHERLGHKKRGGSWVAPIGTRWYPLDRMEELRREWRNAWEFETTHYRLRASVPLVVALDVAVDLERIYRAFFEAFGPDLELHDVGEQMNVQVHGEASSFPESVGASRAYFDPNDETVYVDASGGIDRGTLVHEVTHGVLYWTARRTRSERGDIPGWLDEGLAQYMAAAADGKAGRTEFELGRPDRRLLWVHASAEEPYGLKRVLNFQSGDYGGTSGQLLKYAQSYSLVQFCLHAQGERHRAGFVDYLRQAYVGRATPLSFERALGHDDRVLEEAWATFVAEATR